eukprot:999029-Prymnesium_polylepis.1
MVRCQGRGCSPAVGKMGSGFARGVGSGRRHRLGSGGASGSQRLEALTKWRLDVRVDGAQGAKAQANREWCSLHASLQLRRSGIW